jgi:hypothetical protein
MDDAGIACHAREMERVEAVIGPHIDHQIA